VNFLETCTGYACPPGNKVPSGDVIVHTVHDTLATTGSDPSLLIGGIITAALFMLGGGILFAYNHQRNKERKSDDC
jgi:hypothetical protein